MPGYARDLPAWRCAECRHGRNLTAWGNASVHGKLGADGEIESYDWDEVWEIHEDSIQCDRHPGAVIEKSIGSRWCRWWCCPRCDGDGRDGYCPEEGIRPADGDGKRTAHAGWWPSDEPWPVSALDRRGHVFTPGREPYCRYCRVSAASTAGRELDCEGDRHECPVIVHEGASKTAQKTYRSDDWVCFQPGQMNAAFTEWTCAAGHVITRSAHVPLVPPLRHQQDACHLAEWRCPWKYLQAPEGMAACPST